MNDRFKFRVWDKINNIWVKNFSIDENGCVEGFYNPPQAMNRRLVLMQCTGLKDKNGKLIYEGDIVLLPDEEDVSYVVNYDIDRAMFVVESQILHLCCNFDNYYGKELEVIGNKFENPELLKECE